MQDSVITSTLRWVYTFLTHAADISETIREVFMRLERALRLASTLVLSLLENSEETDRRNQTKGS